MRHVVPESDVEATGSPPRSPSRSSSTLYDVAVGTTDHERSRRRSPASAFSTGVGSRTRNTLSALNSPAVFRSSTDATRGLQFGTALQKLRDANLTLMAMLQRRVLDTTTACHPFRHGALTQLTLPAAAVARMLPSDRVLPLDWATAQKLHLDRDSTLRALIGGSTFARLREEDTATLGLLRLLAKDQEDPTGEGTAAARLRHMKALAFSGKR